MPGRISRRSMAEYISVSLIEGQSKKKLFTQLAGFLIETKRVKELDLIVRDIEFHLAEKGLVQAEVVSAFELTAATQKALTDFVTNQTGATQVSLSNVVDPRVLGGVKVSTPGRLLDQTALHQLTVLKTRFKKA
jgi:ATP synthase F1 delta subunit